MGLESKNCEILSSFLFDHHHHQHYCHMHLYLNQNLEGRGKREELRLKKIHVSSSLPSTPSLLSFHHYHYYHFSLHLCIDGRGLCSMITSYQMYLARGWYYRLEHPRHEIFFWTKLPSIMQLCFSARCFFFAPCNDKLHDSNSFGLIRR